MDRSEQPSEEINMNSTISFSTDFGDALLAFNSEAMVYCEGISDTVAHNYAVNYARTLQTRAKGIEISEPKVPISLFEPTRNWIRFKLEDTYRKHFTTNC
jgi:hypothetical protein